MLRNCSPPFSTFSQKYSDFSTRQGIDKGATVSRGSLGHKRRSKTIIPVIWITSSGIESAILACIKDRCFERMCGVFKMKVLVIRLYIEHAESPSRKNP